MIGLNPDKIAEMILKKAKEYQPCCSHHKEKIDLLKNEVLNCIQCELLFVLFYKELLKAYPILIMILPKPEKIINSIQKLQQERK